MRINLNKKAYEMIYGKAKAEGRYQGAKIALTQVELSYDEIYKHFKDLTVKSEYKLFRFGNGWINQITKVEKTRILGDTSFDYGRKQNDIPLL